MSKKRGLTDSLNNAMEGLGHTFKTQRNFRIHVGAALVVLLAAALLGVSRTEVLVLLVTISFVVIAEMFNTIVELVINMTKEHYHPLARSAKDVAAGCVLLAAVNALCVGYLIFVDPLTAFLGGAVEKAHLAPWHVSFVILAAVVAAVLLIKPLFHKGSPFLGGMPSGHAAFSFSVWTLVALLQSNPWVTLLVLILAFLVARHRVKSGFHTFWESTAGATLGIVVTLLIGKLLGL